MTIQIHAQDTIQVEERQVYSEEELLKLRTHKGFGPKSSEEHVVFSPNHIKVEYCYYSQKGVRYSHGLHYRILNDSTLCIGDSLPEGLQTCLAYKKLENGHFKVARKVEGFLESGEVETLIPLNAVKPYVTTSLNLEDTLWETDEFRNSNPTMGNYTTNFYVSKILGEIYEFDEIDDNPVLLSGDSLPSVRIERIYPCFSQPITWLNAVSVIITKEGKIKNIEQALGNVADNCAYTMMEIARLIAKWGPVKPATINGEPVNVRWFIKVDIAEQPEVHPAFEDTEENRKRYIEERGKAHKKWRHRKPRRHSEK